MKHVTWRWLDPRLPSIQGWKTAYEILEMERLMYNIRNQNVQFKKKMEEIDRFTKKQI